MQHRALGQSEIKLPILGFGTAPNAVLMTGDDESLRLETIKLALDVGIDYFDTASKYGSETNLGRALQILGARPSISTKVVLQHEDLGDPRSAVLKSFDQSLERLGVDHVAAYMLHNRVFHAPEAGAVYADGAQIPLNLMFAKNGIAVAFQELQEAGKVGVCGFTSLGGEASAIREMIDSSLFGAINTGFNIVNPSAMLEVPDNFDLPNYEGVINRAVANGMGVMAIQVLARGNLTGDGLTATAESSALFVPPQTSRQQRVAKTTAIVAETTGDGLEGVAIRYVLSKPGISTAIIGFSQPSHVTAAVKAAEKGPLDDETLTMLETAALS